MEIYNGEFQVYIHTNTINGKKYVGITKQKPEERWCNGLVYTDSPRFYDAIKKYGWKIFEHEIFASGLTEEEACNMEKILIKELDLCNPAFGYNIKEGGTKCSIDEETKLKIGCANRGRKVSAETRKKLSKAHLGKRHTEDEKRKISERNKGKKNPSAILVGRAKRGSNHHFYHQQLSEEHRDKIRKSLKRYYETHDMKPHGMKCVICEETNQIFDSIETAAKKMNIARSSISECCSNKRKSAGGFHWKFAS